MNQQSLTEKSPGDAVIEDIDFTSMLMDDILERDYRIFKDRSVLQPGFVPLAPRHRNRQIAQLVEFFKPCFKGGVPSNLLIYGKTGTGKTLITRHVSRKVKKFGQDSSLPTPFVIYINVQVTNTKYRILSKICRELGLKVPKTGVASDYLFALMKKQLLKMGRVMVVIIDEIDLLVKSREKDDLLYLLTRISEEEPSINVSIIGISNDLRFKTFLGIRVLSSLNAQEIVFPPYTAAELKTILAERARDAFKEGVIDDETIGAIAAMAAKEDGDARKAIALLLKVGEVAESLGANFIDAEHLIMAREKMETDTIEQFITTLPVQYKLVLIALSNAKHYLKCDLNTGNLVGVHSNLVGHLDSLINPIGNRRALQILKDLEDHGLVSLTVVSNGRRGRYTLVRLNLERGMIEKIFMRDPQLAPLLKVRPRVKNLDDFFKNASN